MMVQARKDWFDWIVDSVKRNAWAPVVVMAAHLGISKGTRAYATYASLDIGMHFLGGVAIAWFFWRAVRTEAGARVLGQLSLSGQVVLAGALAGTATVVWECAEWTTDRLGVTHAQAGLPDTMLDMAMGLAGAALVLVVAILRPGTGGSGR